MKIYYYNYTFGSRHSSAVQSWATGWIIGGSIPGRGWEFFSSPPRPDRLWVSHYSPIQLLLGALSLGAKRSGRAAHHSPPSSADVKNAWSYTSTPPYIFMAWDLLTNREKFTFT
jgi:hypothetical protein